jgi:hypothetical protein
MAVFDLVQAQDGSLIVTGNNGVMHFPMQDLKLN